MNIFLQIILLIIGFVMLWKGSDLFVDGAVTTAKTLHISPIVIGLTIVAMGTSFPELAVSADSAIKGNSDIAFGNVVGSNILNILLILGLSAVISNLKVQNSTIYVEIPVMLGATLALLFMVYNGVIDRPEALILLLMFFTYMVYIFVRAKSEKADYELVKEESGIPELTGSKTKMIVLMIFGLALVILGAELSVRSACKLAAFAGISERIIAVTIVALGTSLPELFTSVTAARKGEDDIAIGNIVGSNIFNALLILGVSGMIIPIRVPITSFIDTIFAFGAGVVLYVAISITVRNQLTRAGGITLLVLYAGYLAYTFLF